MSMFGQCSPSYATSGILYTRNGIFTRPILIQYKYLRYNRKAHDILGLIMKIICKSEENFPRYQRIVSDNFSMCNFLLQAIASIASVALRADYK